MTNSHRTFKLTRRQILHILDYSRMGYTQHEIAAALRISRPVIQRVLAHPDPVSACLE